jgi:hypothetical protein
MFRARPDARTRVALLCAGLVGALVLFDFGTIAAARAMGWHPSFVPARHDLFADYFKFVFSFPGGQAVRPTGTAGLGSLLSGYQASNPYGGAEALGRGGMTNLHVTPLTVLFGIANARAMRWVDPVLLFGGLVLGLAAWWVAVAARHAADRGEAVLWSALGLACYPAAMMVVRGNVYAGIAGLLIVGPLLSVLRGGRGEPAAAALALACCIRPNALLFAIPLLLLIRDAAAQRRAACWFATTGIGVTALSLLVVQPLYPDYTPANFRAALATYHRYYVEGGAGLAYNSSLFGALKLAFGLRAWMEGAGMMTGALIAAAAVVLSSGGRLRPSALLFLTCAAYVLGSTVIADYHLLPLLLPPMALAVEARTEPLDRRGWTILAGSCLLLAPKNLFFDDSWSPQVVLNPLVLLGASLWVLGCERHARRSIALRRAELFA